MRKSTNISSDEQDNMLTPNDTGKHDYESNKNETTDAIEYTKNEAKKGQNIFKDLEVIKYQRKECYQPGISEIEKLVIRAPMSTTDKYIFRYEMALNNYDVSHYENYKANNLRKEDIIKILYDLSTNVEYYRIDDIRVERNSIYRMFLLCIFAFVQCQFINWLMFNFVAFILNCQIFVATSAVVFIIRRRQKKIIVDMYKKRHNSIREYLNEVNQRDKFFLKGIFWKSGTMSTWLELHQTKKE